MNLIQWSKIKQEIAKCQDIQQLTKLSYSLEAIQKWSKQSQQSLETQNEIAEYRLRIDRKRGQWVEENVPKEGGNPQDQLAKNSRLIKPTLKDAGVGHNESPKLRAIARLPEAEFEQYIAETKNEGQELTRVGFYKIYTKLRRQKVKNDRASVPPPVGKYRILYADPPWNYNDKRDGRTTGAEDHYPSMSIAQLCQLPIKEITEEDAVLFLWVTSPLLEECFDVIKAWGFSYKSSFVWDKIKHNMGHYNSVRHEFLLVCIKGSCLPDTQKLFDSVQAIERAEHSKKPEEFRNIIDELYTYGNRIELFARRGVKNWEVWGNDPNIIRSGSQKIR